MTRAAELRDIVAMRIKDVELERAHLVRLQRSVDGDARKQAAELEPAWDLLVGILLPDLLPTTLQALVTRIPVTALSPAAVAERRTKMLTDAQGRLKNLLADGRVHNATALVNAIEIKCAELDDNIAPLQASVTLLEDEQMFHELLTWRYGTAEYDVKFWQVSYYRHWKHGDILVEKHGPRLNKTDFGGIVALYVDEKHALRTLHAERAKLVEEHKQISSLLKQLQETQALLADVDSVLLKNARTRLKEYLRVLPDKDLFRVLQSDDAATLAYKRVVGISKKQHYLDALNSEQVKASIAELDASEQKLRRNLTKLYRPKNAARVYTAADVSAMAGPDRSAKWHKRREHYEAARTVVVGFHHYDRYDPMRDWLWWDLMSDGRIDGNFISEVRDHGPSSYHSHHHHHNDAIDVQPAWRTERDVDLS
jgi:hypothetical protein